MDADARANLPQTLTLEYVSPATRLLEKRRQMFEVQEALDAQKEEFARREDAFRRREESLRRSDLELQESLIKFNKFLQENESKRHRALKRAAEEKKQREIKEAEIERLTEQLRERVEEEQRMKTLVEANKKYQNYLDGVVQYVTKDYPEIQDLLNRHRTLTEANSSLTHRQQRNEERAEQKRKALSSFNKEKENELLNLNNKIAELRGTLEDTQSRAIRLQQEVDETIYGASDKTLELGQVLAAIQNSLERCEADYNARHNKNRSSAHMHLSARDKNQDIEKCTKRALQQLDDISLFIIDYAEIEDEYKNVEQQELPRGDAVPSGLAAPLAGDEAEAFS